MKLVLSSLCCALMLALAGAPAQALQSKNVLVVIADDLGVDFVGAYGEGSDPAPTPTIDALASGGVLFRNAWANPTCSPTRACLQTGRYPSRTMVGRFIDYPTNAHTVGTLAAQEVTLPEVLDLAGGGVDHALIGKWHLQYQDQGDSFPNDAGWGHFAGTLGGLGPHSYTSWPRTEDGVTATATTYATTQHVDDALAWLQGRTAPWVCMLSFTAPHNPVHEPPAQLHTQDLSGVSLSNTSRPHYKAMIEAMDTELGRLLSQLGPAVMAETDVIFLGDNGSTAAMAAPPFLGDRAKGTPYEGGVNVPLIVAGPSVVSPGREVADLVSAVDLFPTILGLAGALPALPAWVLTDGVDLTPYLDLTASAPLRDHAFTEQFTGTTWPDPKQSGHATIRDAQYKLIRYVAKQDELYDLVQDPFESDDLLSGAILPQHLAKRGELSAKIDALHQRTPAYSFIGTSTCLGSGGLVPDISATGSPALGKKYTVRCAGLTPGVVALQLIGIEALAWAGTPLPLDLAGFGTGAGCRLELAPLMIHPQTADAQGDADYLVAVHFDPVLVGLNVFHQWLALDPGASALGWVTSPLLAARIGL